MTATVMIATVFRELHRLRRHLRDLRAEIERIPRLLKAHEAKITKQDQALKQAQDDLKHLKVNTHDKEVNLKTTTQLLTKYEKQLNDMKSPKEVELKEKEIATSKKTIAELEEQILAAMAEIDERTAKMPELDKALKSAKAEYSAFEKESKERYERLAGEIKLTEDKLKKQEVHLPATIRGTYDRLVKAYGSDALAMVQKCSCGYCHTSVTAQNVSELMQGRFVACNSCGRMLYPENE